MNLRSHHPPRTSQYVDDCLQHQSQSGPMTGNSRICQLTASKWTGISPKMLVFGSNKCFQRWHTHTHIFTYRGFLVARLTKHSAVELPARADRTFESDHTKIQLIKWTTEEALCVTDACNYETLARFLVYSTTSGENKFVGVSQSHCTN